MKTSAFVFVLLAAFNMALGQAKQAPKEIIFAVLDSGATLEPITFLVGSKFQDSIDGSQEESVLSAFHRAYYKPKTNYSLIFGGAKAGSVTVKSADPKMECSRHTAVVTVASTKARLKGNVMGLAVSSTRNVKGSGVRRLPTTAERAEIEALVREEFSKQKVAASALRKLQYQNLTAVDVDGDASVEFVGSFWVAPTSKTRALLFFIAEKDSVGKYRFTSSEFDPVKQEDTMSDDLEPVDTGVGHELLLDVLDYDGDGTAEIFTYSASFEGAAYRVYKRASGKWTKVYDGANYRCAY